MFHDELLAKLLVSGPPGAGKTTAIYALSEIPPICTEVLATDELTLEKEETTVGMDYGQITLGEGEVIAVYGTPGQPRFSFMWQILLEGADHRVAALQAALRKRQAGIGHQVALRRVDVARLHHLPRAAQPAAASENEFCFDRGQRIAAFQEYDGLFAPLLEIHPHIGD